MLFQEILIEILCTYTIVFLTSYARIACDLNSSNDHIQIGLVNAFSTAVFIFVCYPQTRCHFSPTLTVADMIYKDLEFMEGMMILISQFVGCLFANACVVLTLTDIQIDLLASKSVIGMSMIQPGFNSINGFLTDVLLSSLFVFANLTYADQTKNGRDAITKFAMVRSVVILLISLAGESISGTDSNPFAVLSAAILTKHFELHQWIYFISPIVASFIGGILYNPDIISQLFISENKENKIKVD